MGAIKGLTEKTAHSIMTPLERIAEKKDWPDQIYRQASFAKSALNTDLKIGIDIVTDFEKHRAWEYMEQDRETFYRFRLNIDPASLPNIMEGYKVLVAQGLTPTHWRQAVEAAKPLPKVGESAKTAKRGKDGKWIATGNQNLGRHRGGNSQIIARLKRDHPDIAQRLANGEFRSVRAAARAAGIQWFGQAPSSLVRLRYNWRKASEEQRRAFLSEIGAVIAKSA